MPGSAPGRSHDSYPTDVTAGAVRSAEPISDSAFYSPSGRATAGQGNSTTWPAGPSARPTVGRVDRFALIDRIGAGGFGEVWRAFDPHLERDVAIKLAHVSGLDDGRPELLLHEARAAGRLSHPSIVPVHETGVDGDVAYIVSDYVPGTTLERRIKAGPLSPRDAAELAKALAEGLAHAHERGVVHRDVKPSNVLLDATGKPHLADFGVARRVSGGRTISTVGEALGTPAYMAPEQAAGDMSAVDARSDVYALGLVLYEMLAGRRAYPGTAAEALRDVLAGSPASLRSIRPDVPSGLAAIVDAATARERSRRYPDAGEFARDLDRFLRGEMPGAARRVARRRGTPVGAHAAVAAAVVAVVLVQSGGLDDAGRGSALAAGKQLVEILTETPPDRMWLVPYDPLTGWLMAERRIDIPDPSNPVIELDCGEEYLVVADWGGGRFSECDRRVPTRPEIESDLHSLLARFAWQGGTGGAVRIELTAAPPPALDDFIPIPGGDVVDEVSGQRVSVPSFHLASHALTAAEYLAIESAWLRRNGRRGPARLPSYLPKDFPLDQAVPLNHTDASSIAAKAGCRLPGLFELGRAAQSAGTGPQGASGSDVAFLRAEPAEMTGSRLSAFPWDVTSEFRSEMAGLRRKMFVDPTIFADQSYFVFGRLSEPSRPTSGTPRGVPGRQAVALSEHRTDVVVRLARSVRPRRDAKDFVRVAAPDDDAARVAGSVRGAPRDSRRVRVATPAAAQVSSGSIRIMRTK